MEILKIPENLVFTCQRSTDHGCSIHEFAPVVEKYMQGKKIKKKYKYLLGKKT